MREIWKPLPREPSMYEVSNLGRVRSLTRTRNGEFLIRKAVPDKDGYHRISLFSRNDPRRGNYFVHRLVLEAFVGECPEGQEARHKNGVRGDNRVSNLKWGTKLENMEDRDRHGNNTAKGDTNPRAAANDSGKRCSASTLAGTRCQARAYVRFKDVGWLCGSHQHYAGRKMKEIERWN